MKRVLMIALAALSLAGSAISQTPAPPAGAPPASDAKAAEAAPMFDVVDVHPSAHTRFQRFMQGGRLVGERYSIKQATIPDLVAKAYGVDVQYVSGGPTWLEMEHYDVVAKAPVGTPEASLKLMLRGVLKDRFALVVHDGNAPMPAYVLHLADGAAKPKPASESDGNPGCNARPDPSSPPNGPFMALLSCRAETMEQFANFLQQVRGFGYLNSPVVDATGLKDPLDLDLKLTPSGALSVAGGDGTTLFDALQKQAGLKLALETAPRPVLIIDSVNETPTANVPGVEKLLPPPPVPQFEVSTVRPAKPDERGQGTMRGGQLDLHGITLKDLMSFGWDIIPADQEGLVNAPAWLDKDKFDFLAKVASSDDGSGSAKPPQLDNEELAQLVRGLVEDRFKMKSHFENRPVTVYTLVAAGPKIKPAADPKSRTKCTEGVGPDGKDPRQQFPTRNRLMWCQNMTMEMFARELQYLANGFIYYPVTDGTGLKGGYDFALNFTSIQLMNQGSGGGGGGGAAAGGAGGGAGASASPAASDPNGAISLFDAIRTELGLKLEKGKRDEPVLVIDHIEEQPTEN